MPEPHEVDQRQAQIYPLERRRSYWDRSIDPSWEERLRFKGLWSLGLDVTGPSFDALTATVADILHETLIEADQPCASDTFDAVLESLNRTERIRVKRDYDRLTTLECQLVELLRPVGLLDGITAMEFPINVRVVHGRAPENYHKSRYPTDLLHSDLWSNEPNDIVNGVLYLGGDIERTFMRLFECSIVDSDQIARFRGSYGGQPAFTHLLKEIPTNPMPGVLILMDGVCPHQTCRGGGGVRVSLDFRLRRENAYGMIDERWMQTQQAFARYWTLNTGSIDRFEEKCRHERAGLSGEALAARDRAIHDLVGPGSP